MIDEVSIEARKARDVGDVLAAARNAAGLTQQEVADRVGVTRQYLADMESGRGAHLFMTRLFRIARLLRVRITVSFDGIDDA